MEYVIDTSGETRLFGSAEPVVNFKTKEPVFNRVSGAAEWRVHLMRFKPDQRPETETVKVEGEPEGLVMGQPVRVVGLSLTFWQMTDENSKERSGVSLRAERVVPAEAPVSRAPAGKGAAS
jgi:hypothetical protein